MKKVLMIFVGIGLIAASFFSMSGGKHPVWEDIDGLSATTLMVNSEKVYYAEGNQITVSKIDKADSAPAYTLGKNHNVLYLGGSDEYSVVISEKEGASYLNVWKKDGTQTVSDIELAGSAPKPHITANVAIDGDLLYLGRFLDKDGASHTYLHVYDMTSGQQKAVHKFDKDPLPLDNLRTFVVRNGIVIAGSGTGTKVLNAMDNFSLVEVAVENSDEVASAAHWIRSDGEYAIENNDSGQILIWKWTENGAEQTATVDSEAAATLRALEFSEDGREGLIITRRTGVVKSFDLATGRVNTRFVLNDPAIYKKNGVNAQFRDIHKVTVGNDVYFIVGGEFDKTGNRGAVLLYKNPSGDNPAPYYTEEFPWAAYSMWLQKISGEYFVVTKDWKYKGYEPEEKVDSSGKLSVIKLIAK